MKICILSMQKVNNFGSLLQSYALKKIIESLDNKVSFIDIERIEDDNKLMEYEADDYSFESNKSKNIFNKVLKIDKYFWNRIIIKLRSNKQKKEFQKFRNNVLQIRDEDNNSKYDICVIGSDEVFNCNAISPWGFTSQLFGNVRQVQNVITYAASCGSTKFENVSSVVRGRIMDTFQNVKAFSVRDENTYEFVTSMTNRKVERHMDPVLVGDFDDEISKADITSLNLPERFCIVYSYYNRINKEDEINNIKHFCKLQNLDIISIGGPQMWIKKHLVLTPFQMLKIFQKAEFVITDTFHGTIFATRYAKKFAIKLRESNRNKLHDLVNRLHLEKNLINSFEDLFEVYAMNIDREEILNLLNEEKNKTLQYFLENLTTLNKENKVG